MFLSFIQKMSIADFTRDKDLDDHVFGLAGIIMDVTSSHFSNEITFRISQGDGEICYFSMMIG